MTATTMAQFHAAPKPCEGKTDLMFPEFRQDRPGSKRNERAKRDAKAAAEAYCAGCTLKKPCLKFAMDTKTEHGVWGGLYLDNPQAMIWAKRKNRLAQRKEPTLDR